MIKNILLIFIVFLIACNNLKEESFVVTSNNVHISESETVNFIRTENIIFFRENRSKTKTRTTGVHYLPFPAKNRK